MALPIPTSKPSQTLVGRRNLVTITPTGGSAISRPVVSMQFESTREWIEREAPTDEEDSILFIDRRIPTRRTDSVVITLDEWDEDLIALATGSDNTCTFLAQAVDPSRSTGYLSLRFSKADGDAVAGTCKLEGDTTLDREQLATYQLRLTATEEAKYYTECEIANVVGDGELDIAFTFASGDIYLDDDDQTTKLTASSEQVLASVMGNRVRLFGDIDRITEIEINKNSDDIDGLRVNLTQFPLCEVFVGIEEVTEIELSPIVNTALDSINLVGTVMSAANLNKMFEQLPDRSATTQGALDLTGAVNIGDATTSIATAKNWDVITS